MIELLQGDAFRIPLDDGSVHCIVTSPPYWGLRDYGIDGQIGLEPTPELYVQHIVEVFRELWRVLHDMGTCWLNLGDSYAGSGGPGSQWDNKATSGFKGAFTKYDNPNRQVANLKPKDLCMIPARVALALQADGWWLRSAITWCKKAPMPESVRDRPTKATEQVYLLTKSSHYFWDADAVRGLSKSLNLGYSVNKELGVSELSASSSFSAKSGNVSSYRHVAPYFVLACLLTAKRIPIKERNSYFHQVFDTFKSPMTDRPTMFSGLHVPQLASEFIVNILQNWEVVIPKLNLQTETKFWIGFRSALADTIISIQATLSIEEANEIVSKIISNIQIIRQTFSLDTILKGLIDVDFINKSISLFDCSALFVSQRGDSLVTKTLFQEIGFLFDNMAGDLRTVDIGHSDNYTTQIPTSQRNIWDWWVIGPEPYPGSHFAVFPSKLVEPMIKAGTSERGACPECGCQWERITTSERKATRPGRDNKYPEGKQWNNKRFLTTKQTLGWQPTCKCKRICPSCAGGSIEWTVNSPCCKNKGYVPHDPIPAIVFDPFVGSGTVLQVARKLGRSAVGVDLSHEYLGLARERLSLDRWGAWVNSGKGQPSSRLHAAMTDLPLFQDTHD